MKTIKRSLRGLCRRPFGTLLLILLLTVSISLSLIMLVVSGAFDAQIMKIRSEVGTDIYLIPSGVFEPGTVPTMAENLVDQLSGLPHVKSIGKKYSISLEEHAYKGAALTEEGKKLMQNRGMTEEAMQGLVDNASISITGSNTPNALSSRGRVTSGLGVVVEASPNVTIIEGTTFTLEQMDANIGLVSQGFALSNNLTVGDTLDIQGNIIEIIGIFATVDGDVFGQNTLFMPLGAVQRIFEKEGILTSAIVFADDAVNVGAVVSGIGTVIENPNYTTNEEAFKTMAQPLENARNGSQIAMLSSLGACVVIILFAVILTIRNRVKEIGILKAIGARNSNVSSQFGIENAIVGLIAALLGGLMTFLFAEGVAKQMIKSSIMDANISVAVSPTVFAIALGIALSLTIIGSVLPALRIARIKPAEVLRYE